MYSSSQISSLNAFVSPLKSYGSPTQPSTAQASSTPGVGNLDDQVKAIAMQYQFTSSYKVPTSGINLQNTSEQYSAYLPNQYSQQNLSQNQIPTVISHPLKASQYQHQQQNSISGPSFVQNDASLGTLGGFKNPISEQSPYQFSNFTGQGSQIQYLGTPLKQSGSFQSQLQLQQGINFPENQVTDNQRENLRMKVDEIVNQVKKSMLYQGQVIEQPKQQIQTGDQLSSIPSYANYSISNGEVRFPQQAPSLSSELYKVDNTYNQVIGSNYQKSDISPIGQTQNYSLNQQFKHQNSIGFTSGASISSAVPFQQIEQKNQYIPSFNMSTDYLGKDMKINQQNYNNSYQTIGFNSSITDYQQKQPQQQTSIYQGYMQDSFNSKNQITPLNQQNVIESKATQSNYGNSETYNQISNAYDLNSNISKYQNPLSSNFEKSSINEALSGTIPHNSDSIIQVPGVVMPTTVVKQNSNFSEVPSELQSVNLQYSITASQLKDQNFHNTLANQLNNEDQQRQMHQEYQLYQTTSLSKHVSNDYANAYFKMEESQNLQHPQKQQGLKEIQQEEKQKSHTTSPNKQVNQSPFKYDSQQSSENVLSQSEKNNQNSQQMYTEIKGHDSLNQLSQQNNTFDTLQNDTQHQESQNETVKRSKNQQASPLKSQLGSPPKDSKSLTSQADNQQESPKSTQQWIIQKNINQDQKDQILTEENQELNQWLDPVFQDFIKKNYTKQQKKVLIEQLSKQIQSDSEDPYEEEEEEEVEESKQNSQPKNKHKSPKGSPYSNKSQDNSQKSKQSLNLYERYNQSRKDPKKSPQNSKESKQETPQKQQENKFTQIKEIKSEQEQLEYIQFSQRCKAELERQQHIKLQKKKNKEITSEFNNQPSQAQQKPSLNGFQSVESFESNENVIMTKESKLLLQEIYNEVQSALKKYDYIIQENQKNRKNQEYLKKEQNFINVETNSQYSDSNNLITANSLKTNTSQKRFETQNQDTDDQSQNLRKPQVNHHYHHCRTPQNLNRKNNNQASKTSLSGFVKTENKNSLGNFNHHSDSQGTIVTSPNPKQNGTTNKVNQRSISNQVVGTLERQRFSKMEENEAESAYNNRKQEIIKVLQHHSKQRKNSIQQKPMNHSISKTNTNTSHARTPSNSMSNRNSQVFQNQINDQDLNNSITSGGKHKSVGLLNKLLSPKNNHLQNITNSNEISSPSQSLKASLFAGKSENQIKKVNQNFDKNAFLLTDNTRDQISKKDNETSLQFVDEKLKYKVNEEPTINTIIVSEATIPQEKVKRMAKSNDENKQKIRKKSILHINLMEKEAYEINLDDQEKKKDKKQKIKDRKERIDKIYNQAQQQINNSEKQILQKKSHLQLPISDPNIQLNIEEDAQANSNTQRLSSQNFIQLDKQERNFLDDEDIHQNEVPNKMIKRSNSASYNLLQQKKLAILHDIEDLNKLIEIENQEDDYEVQQNQEQHHQVNENKNILDQQQKQFRNLQQADSRKSSKHQSQARSRNNSVIQQQQQEFHRPSIQGTIQTNSVTELAVDQPQFQQIKLVAPPIPLMKIRDQENSDLQSISSNNNNNINDNPNDNFKINKEKFLQQLQQQNQNLQREAKRVNSHHIIQSKDIFALEKQGYGMLKRKEIQQKENNSGSASKSAKKPPRVPQYYNNEDQDQDEQVHQINIYRSLSPNRYQQNGSQTTKFHERNKKWLEDKKNKMEETQKNCNYLEMKECTFKPQTNKQLIKYNPYVHKDQLKYMKSNVSSQNSKSQKSNLSPRVAILQQKHIQNQQNNHENFKALNSHSSRAKKESEDLGKLQGLQSPIMQRYSEVEFWSQSDASVFKAINDIDTSYQTELKKEINDVLDIIQGFQINDVDRSVPKKQTTVKKNAGSKDYQSKLINTQKFKL